MWSDRSRFSKIIWFMSPWAHQQNLKMHIFAYFTLPKCIFGTYLAIFGQFSVYISLKTRISAYFSYFSSKNNLGFLLKISHFRSKLNFSSVQIPIFRKNFLKNVRPRSARSIFCIYFPDITKNCEIMKYFYTFLLFTVTHLKISWKFSVKLGDLGILGCREWKKRPLYWIKVHNFAFFRHFFCIFKCIFRDLKCIFWENRFIINPSPTHHTLTTNQRNYNTWKIRLARERILSRRFEWMITW